jgi:hypothetical protein
MRTILLLLAMAGTATAAEYGWQQTDQSLALKRGTNVVWQFNYPKEGKPYFHPVTLGGGSALTALSPSDHPWHKGIWFSWKYINKINYWEYEKKTGLEQGRTEVLSVTATPRDDHSARFVMKLGYHPPGQPNLLTEERVIEVSAPDKDDGYRIDWAATFTAGDTELLFDRTPPYNAKDGVKHGGYAGLSLRLAATMKNWQFLDSEGRADSKDQNGLPARWQSFSGAKESITVLDHPQSFRHPTPWYLVKSMPFFQPAILFADPYKLPAGKSFSVKYRILVGPGTADQKHLEAQWKSFSR